MRVIAGVARGRRLVAPRGRSTRPTPDRVREALFSILGVQVDGAKVLDLYAGTGSLGLEALSRGAELAVFVEQDRGSLSALRQNVEAVGLNSASVMPMSVSRALRQLEKQGSSFDLVFADPPYAKNLLPETLAALVEHSLLNAEALIVCEHASNGAAPESIHTDAVETRRYGDVSLTLLRPKALST